MAAVLRMRSSSSCRLLKSCSDSNHKRKESGEQGKKSKNKIKHTEKDVRLLAEKQTSYGGSRPSSHLKPKDTHQDDATTSTETTALEVEEAQQTIDLKLQLLKESLMEDPLDCSLEALTVPRTWQMRQTLSVEKWETARPHLLDLMLSAEKPLLELCDHCNIEQAVIRCRDCLPKHDCDVFHHQSWVLHNRDSLVEGFYTAIPPTCYALLNDDGTHTISEQARLLPVARPSNICSCDAADITVCTGRYDLSLPTSTCRSCLTSWTPGLKDLQASGYWPGNVVFQTLYAIDVFKTFEELKVTAPGLSRQAFVKMLEQRSSTFGRAGSIYGDSLQRSFLEWTYCRDDKDKLLHKKPFSCPACAEDVAAISLDGNRKMYRFSRTKGVGENAFFDGAFFAKDKDVADFVQLIRNRVQPVSGKGVCGKSQWTAARETANKSGSKVDEEGVEVAVCRHGILFKALNMFRGEIFAYPLFLQKELAMAYKIQFICTDIMCKYYPYLQKVCESFPELVPLLQNRPFLSVMHAKGHSGKCEVQWGGRNQEGAGMTVGEEVEQVNSFLSRVALTTKYMTKSTRTDMITIQARGWNERKKKDLHKYLSQRYVKDWLSVAPGVVSLCLPSTLHTTRLTLSSVRNQLS